MLTITYAYDGMPPQTISFAETTSAIDQTASIQFALDAVAGHAGATVTLSTGTFTVCGTGTAADGCLRVGSETTLSGAGMGETIIKLDANSPSVTGIVRTDSGETLADGTIKTTSNVTISDLSIDGSKESSIGTVDGFYCGPQPNNTVYDSNITLTGVEIYNCSRYGFNVHEQTHNLTLDGCVAHDMGFDGFVLDFTSDSVVKNCTSFDNGRHGFNIVTSSDNILLENDSAYGNGGSGVVIQTGNNEIRAFTGSIDVIGGSFYDNDRYGIEARQCEDIAIIGNDISGNGLGGVTLEGVENVALTGNNIHDNAGTPITIAGYLQTFGDTDTANDAYIPTHNVTIDGVLQSDPVIPPGVTIWSWSITDGNDYINGTSAADAFATGRGNDVIYGNGGNDTLYGGVGDDWLNGGAGNDSVNGNVGNDRLMYSSGFDALDGGAGTDTADFSLFGNAVYVDLRTTTAFTSGGATATITNALTAIATIANIENVLGTTANDEIHGDRLSNILQGNAGNDALYGEGGNDVLDGGTGNDFLSGGAGNDALCGGLGNDTLNGGTGSDNFYMTNHWGYDVVQDFARGKDKIVFQGVDGLTAYAQLTITNASGGALVTFGTDQVLVQGVTAAQLTSADFVF